MDKQKEKQTKQLKINKDLMVKVDYRGLPTRATKTDKRRSYSGTTRTLEAIRQAHRLSGGGRLLESRVNKELLLEEV